MKGVVVYRCRMCAVAFEVPYDDVAKGLDELVHLNRLTTIHEECPDLNGKVRFGVADLLGLAADKSKEEVTGG
jgi:hypothetical protein